MKSRKKVLVFIDWFEPAYKAGGPIKSVKNIISSLSDEIDFMLITSNLDADGACLDVEVNSVINRENFKIVYLNRERNTLDFYRQMEKDFQPDILYFNSVFSFQFCLKPLWYFKGNSKARIILAPRGMLGKGALAIKPIRKKVFLFLTKNFLFKNITWHASTHLELDEIKRAIGKKIKAYVAQNISSNPIKRNLALDFKQKNELSLVFISRISQKKNLGFLLEIFKELKELDGLKLSIYGPIEETSYWEKCKSMIDADSRILFHGSIKPYEIEQTLSNYQVYTLPSLNENYGHSIVEAINAGLPVLISDQTPWIGLEQEKVGFSLTLEKEKWKSAIKNLYEMDNSTFSHWSSNCYEFSMNHFVSLEIIKQNKGLFLS